MEQFSEAHSKLLLGKEWLVKTDGGSAYLFKFHSSTVDSTCLIMVTDTKSVWAEVLTSNLIARRWRACNHADASMSIEEGEETSWRSKVIESIAKLHTPGTLGLEDISFEIIESDYSDLAFEIDCEIFKWTWETCYLGHKKSAEIISTHLVLPLISLSHVSFSAGGPAEQMSNSDLEKTIDKLGRINKKMIDTHVKIAVSKPRLTTSIRRVTAAFNSIPEPLPIISTNDIPELQKISPPRKLLVHVSTPTKLRAISPNLIGESNRDKTPLKPPSSPPASCKPSASLTKRVPAGSATEESDDDEPKAAKPVAAAVASTSSNACSPPPKLSKSPAPVKSATRSKSPTSETDSSPARPSAKKKKVETSSEDDSEEERRERVARHRNGGGARAGVRQPLKRGGKRF